MPNGIMPSGVLNHAYDHADSELNAEEMRLFDDDNDKTPLLDKPFIPKLQNHVSGRVTTDVLHRKAVEVSKFCLFVEKTGKSRRPLNVAFQVSAVCCV